MGGQNASQYHFSPTRPISSMFSLDNNKISPILGPNLKEIVSADYDSTTSTEPENENDGKSKKKVMNITTQMIDYDEENIFTPTVKDNNLDNSDDYFNSMRARNAD